jgi:hypothetical protein
MQSPASQRVPQLANPRPYRREAHTDLQPDEILRSLLTEARCVLAAIKSGHPPKSTKYYAITYTKLFTTTLLLSTETRPDQVNTSVTSQTLSTQLGLAHQHTQDQHH